MQNSSEKKLQLSLKEIFTLRKDYLTATYMESIMKIAIYQRGQRLSSSHYSTRTEPATSSQTKNAERRKSSLAPMKITSKTSTSKFDDSDDESNLPSRQVLNEMKLEKDLDDLVKIFTEAHEEVLQENQLKHEKLIAAIEAQNIRNGEEERLIQEMRHNQATLKSLKAQMETECIQGKEQLQMKEEEIAIVREKLSSVCYVNELELDLVERWERSRHMQANMVVKHEERNLEQRIDELKQSVAKEQRLIKEVRTFNIKQFDDLRTRIADWKLRYSSELDKKQQLIKEEEQRIEDLKNKYERHTETYKERVKFVDEYLALKAEQQRLFEQQMHRIECAIRIQAWWRGLMVRHGLGPFKRKTKKGKKLGKAGKEKK